MKNMMDSIFINIQVYLLVGFLWLLVHEIIGMKMNNGFRFRLWVLWPFTMLAWIIGFIEAFRNRNNSNDW
tara:strand:+ start:911 stop:1120 length:210 start_codon:yes stop_codon:yes gene_type:complete